MTDDFPDVGDHSLLVSWQFIGPSGGNWLRLLAQGSGTPNPQLDLRQPISFRMRLLPVDAEDPPLQICTQPQGIIALQSQSLTLDVRAVGTEPLPATLQAADAVLAPIPGICHFRQFLYIQPVAVAVQVCVMEPMQLGS